MLNPPRKRYVARRTDGQKLRIYVPAGEACEIEVIQRKGWEIEIEYDEGIRVQRVEERETA